jgi:hypothetical protein
MNDSGFVRPRWHADPQAAFGMEVDGRLAGSVFLSEWGNFVFCGPLSIDPAFWGQELVHYLMAPVMARMDRRHTPWPARMAFPTASSISACIRNMVFGRGC